MVDFPLPVLVSGRLNHLHVEILATTDAASTWLCEISKSHYSDDYTFLTWQGVFGMSWILRVCLKNRDTTSPETAVVYVSEHGAHFDVTWTIQPWNFLRFPHFQTPSQTLILVLSKIRILYFCQDSLYSPLDFSRCMPWSLEENCFYPRAATKQIYLTSNGSLKRLFVSWVSYNML